MAAINNISWFREHLFLRIYGIIFWLFGLAIYLMFVTFGWLGSREIIKALSFPGYIGILIKDILLFPGLIPLIVGGFFLVFFRRSQDFFIGLLVILPIFIVLHYIVAAVSAHDNGWQYLGFQLFEIFCAAAVIIKYQCKWRRLSSL